MAAVRYSYTTCMYCPWFLLRVLVDVFIGSPRSTPALSLGSLTQRKQVLSAVPSNFCHSQTPSQAEWEGGRAKAYRNVSNPSEKIPVLCHGFSLLTQHSCLILGRGGQQLCLKMRHPSHRWIIVLFIFYMCLI